jgi:hypothetical protein
MSSATSSSPQSRFDTAAETVAASETVISAYLRIYSKAQLTAALTQALADRASGVQVTQVNFQDGGGAGQVIAGDPNEVIEILELCLQRLENPDAAGPKPLSARMSFRFRRSET